MLLLVLLLLLVRERRAAMLGSLVVEGVECIDSGRFGVNGGGRTLGVPGTMLLRFMIPEWLIVSLRR